MQSFQQTMSQNHSSNPKAIEFAPFLAKSLEVSGARGFLLGAVCFNPTHNLIIACPRDDTMQFYDATTFLPIKGRETLKLDSSVQDMSYHPETDTYLVGCLGGSIYLYSAPDHRLKELKKCDNEIWSVTFLNTTYYAFSKMGSYSLSVGTLGSENMQSFDLRNCDAYYLQPLSGRNLLISGLENGYVLIYRTDKLPRLRIFCSVKANQGDYFYVVQSFNVNGKEYVITGCRDECAKVWHLVKGRMRLLKVIQTGGSLDSVVYLESYKMLAMIYSTNKIEFFRFPSGKLERTVSLSQKYADFMFLMKEKNMIGVTSETGSNLIEFIQLSG